MSEELKKKVLCLYYETSKTISEIAGDTKTSYADILGILKEYYGDE